MATADKKRTVRTTGKIVRGGKLRMKSGVLYTFTGKDKQWASGHIDEFVTVDIVLSPLGRGMRVKRLPPSRGP